MSVTVIDFGPVDWGKIWGDRAGLVNDVHLKELNSITNATHLSSPGYWRNLFASYPEVTSKAGLIAQRYVIPGQHPKSFKTEIRAPIITPMQANKQIEDKRNQTIHEIEDMQREAKELEKHPFKKAFYITKREVSETTIGKSVVEVANNTMDVVGDVGQTLGNITEAAKDLTGYVRGISANADNLTTNYPMYVMGATIAGAFLLAKITQ